MLALTFMDYVIILHKVPNRSHSQDRVNYWHKASPLSEILGLVLVCKITIDGEELLLVHVGGSPFTQIGHLHKKHIKLRMVQSLEHPCHRS